MAIFEYYKESFTTTQYRSYMALHLTLTLLYCLLFALWLANAWSILYKQQRWRTMTLLFFYIFSFIAILGRIIACLSAVSLKTPILVINDS